jgi:uncharacterized protein YbaP (TraB family)
MFCTILQRLHWRSAMDAFGSFAKEDIMIERGPLAASMLAAAAFLAAACAQAVAQDLQKPSCPPAAASPTLEQVQVGMRTARNHGFLWQITKDGRNSYLYGTLHIAKQDWMYLGEAVQNALRASDRLVLELDLLDAGVAQRLQKAMATSESDPVLPEPLAARMRAEAERACFQLPALNAMFPEMQLYTLGVLASRGDGIYADYGSEFFLSGFARGLRKPVISLETPELQMRALRVENRQDRDDVVEKWLGKLETGRWRALQLRLSEMWADSRVDELRRYTEWCECLDTEAERREWRRTIDDRNPGLADSIVSILDSGQTVFAAIGSLHMVGANGLPALLAKRGYQIEFLPFSPQ